MLLWAARRLLDETQGPYDPQRLAALDLPERVRTMAEEMAALLALSGAGRAS